MMKASAYDFIFYGDDFTGSTDALEFLMKYGVPAILFLEVPDQQMLDRFPTIKAFGVAGATRSMSTDQMIGVLEKDLAYLGTYQPKILHYKVCSTFDSSVAIGSIGAVIKKAFQLFALKRIPVLGGMPLIGRFCSFSNLFVRMGIGTSGKIYRLDQHPSMKNHPVTPAMESDLRMLIAGQSDLKVGGIDLERMKSPFDQWLDQIDENVLVVDAITEEHLRLFQQWLDYLYEDEMIFTVGSSGVEAAFAMIHGEQTHFFNPEKVGSRDLPILVVSGSQSPVTQKQIESAADAGFSIHCLNVDQLDSLPDDTFIKEVIVALSEKKDVLIYSGERLEVVVDSRKLGNWYGQLVKAVAAKVKFNKLVICGGDTSSYVARAMQIDAVEMIQSFVPGAPICKVHSTDPFINGLHINVKGGQVGGLNYLIDIKSK